jgi:hypothetical protein
METHEFKTDCDDQRDAVNSAQAAFNEAQEGFYVAWAEYSAFCS